VNENTLQAMRRPVHKQEAIRTIESLPESVSLDDIIEALCVRLAVEEGMADGDAGRYVEEEQLDRRFGK